MVNDPVFQRPMFQGMAPTVPVTGGIASVTTPEDNARALRNMFAPPLPVQPVQSFQDGGFAELLRGSQGSSLMRLPDYLTQLGGAGGGIMEGLRDRFLASRGVRLPSMAPPPPPRPSDLELMSAEDRAAVGAQGTAGEAVYSPDPSRPVVSQAGPAPAPPAAAAAPPPVLGAPAAAAATAAPERQKGALELTLEGIREERARSAEDKRQNALLALMQAGLAMAGGTSPNALTNIAAGGQSGIAAFANMERARREEQAALRREETALTLAREQMRAQEERAPEQIRTLAMLGGWTPEQGREGFNAAVTKGLQVQKSMLQDPEMIRTFQILGEGDVRKGFEIFNADKKLQAAATVVKDITASAEDRRIAQDYINSQIGRARTGGGTFQGFSATPVR